MGMCEDTLKGIEEGILNPSPNLRERIADGLNWRGDTDELFANKEDEQ